MKKFITRLLVGTIICFCSHSGYGGQLPHSDNSGSTVHAGMRGGELDAGQIAVIADHVRPAELSREIECIATLIA